MRLGNNLCDVLQFKLTNVSFVNYKLIVKTYNRLKYVRGNRDERTGSRSALDDDSLATDFTNYVLS